MAVAAVAMEGAVALAAAVAEVSVAASAAAAWVGARVSAHVADSPALAAFVRRCRWAAPWVRR